MSPVVQSARERVSPVREPWSPGALVCFPKTQGPSPGIVPQPVRPCTTIEMSSQVYRGRDFLHVPHLSQYRLNGLTARTQAPKLHCMPAQFHFGSL